MQNLWCLDVLIGILMGAGAGVMDHQPPALRGLVIHVSGDHVRTAGAVGRQDVNFLEYVMDSASQRIYSPYVLWPYMDGTAVRKHGFECSADSTSAAQSASTGMNASDIVFVRPASHEFFDIPQLQRFVKSGLHFIGGPPHHGMQFCFVSWHGGILSHLLPARCALAVGCMTMFRTGTPV